MTVRQYEEHLKLDRAIDWLEREIVDMKIRAEHSPATGATVSGVHQPRAAHPSQVTQ